MRSFLRAHDSEIKGTLSGFDRVRFRGTLRLLANVLGLGSFLSFMNIWLKDFKAWSMDLTERIRAAAEELTRSRGRKVVYLESCYTDKEELALKIAREEGITEGLICLVTCVESCNTFHVRRDRDKKLLVLSPMKGRCLHQYFYVRHPQFGLINIRVQTWVPFTIHVNINGREWLEHQLQRADIPYTKRDNCFVDVQDVARAQQLLDEQLGTNWEQVLNDLIREFHPLHAHLLPREHYYWSADTTEWATDVMFRSAEHLDRIYPALVRHCVMRNGCDNVLRYLGRRGTAQQFAKGEITTSILRRHEGIRCKHSLNANSIKMYDKQESVLRIETTINNPRDMRVYRRKESHPDGRQWERLRKGVSDLHRRTEISQSANERFLESLATVEHAEPMRQTLKDVCRPTRLNGRRVRSLNPFHADDSELLQAINRGEFAINGFRNRDLQPLIASRSRHTTPRQHAARITRLLRLLRAHRLIRKVPKTHRYVLTAKGRLTITTILAAQQANTQKLAQLAV
jgi:hypothetical protein